MIIKVDTREQELLKQIKNLVLFIPAFKDITLMSETLPIGDIIIACALPPHPETFSEKETD